MVWGPSGDNWLKWQLPNSNPLGRLARVSFLDLYPPLSS